MSRNSNSRRGRQPSKKPLRFESLEERRMLAAAAFVASLHQDVGGQPGALISDGTVRVGDTFIVEITAQDMSATPVGLRGVGLRIQWDPKALAEIDLPFDPSDPNSPLVTQSFPMWRGGTLDNADGVIDKLQGTTIGPLFGPGNVIGVSGPDIFSVLQFRADAPVQDSSISIDGRPGIAFADGQTYTVDDLSFQPAVITVLPASQVATTATTTTSISSGPTTTTTPSSSTVTIAPGGTTTISPTSSTTTALATQAAVVGPQTSLYQDDDGVPGSQITNDMVTAGSSGLGIVDGTVAPGYPLVGGGVSIQPLTVAVVPAAASPQIAVTTSDATSSSIQFTTLVDSGDGSSTCTSPLVRPADPDTKQYIDVTNSGGSPLTINQIEINAPDVTVDQAVPLAIAAGQTVKLDLKYRADAPQSPG